MPKNDRCYRFFKPCKPFKPFRPFSQWQRAQAAVNLIAFAVFYVFTFQATAAVQRVHIGVVTRVVDGDTFWLKTSNSQKTLKVRIQGIDAPEICQSGGVQARHALQRRVLGKSVTVTSRAHDEYGRSVGLVRMGSQDMGRWLVSEGHAWVDNYRQKKSPYADELKHAQLARRGIFKHPHAEQPRLFRMWHGSCKLVR